MARGRGGLSGVLCFSLGSRLRGNDGGGLRERGECAGEGGRLHPLPSPLPSRERGFKRRALLFSGFPPARE